MKTTFFSNRISVLILMACFLGFSTCKKDTDKNNETGPSYRVISSNDFANDVLSANSNMTYKGEKISMINGYDYTTKGDSTKSEFEYPDGSTIVETGYDKAGVAWDKTYQTEFKFNGSNISRVIIYNPGNGIMVPYLKIDFQFENGNMIQETYTSYDAGTWYPFVKVAYVYDGNNAVQSEVSMNLGNGWEVSYKEVATYNGAELVTIIEYEYSGGSYLESYKYDFVYENGQMKRIDLYYYEETWNSDGAMTYSYDEFGNLASSSEPGENEINKTEYTYEAAKGNLEQIHFGSGGLSGMIFTMPGKSINELVKNINKFLAKKAERR